VGFADLPLIRGGSAAASPQRHHIKSEPYRARVSLVRFDVGDGALSAPAGNTNAKNTEKINRNHVFVSKK
jgi:hypothetical protein